MSQPIAERLLQAGDIIAGKYQIERVLGEGGMGMVFLATHLQLREPVALKFMNAAALANPEASARFVREARAAARLRGEHVCRVLDLGETDEGDRYIVIEYLDGRDLSEVLIERGALPISEAVDYILQACEAMAEAHGAGIVHRDLKPANLFLTKGTDGADCIKVVDFGISKLINPETNAAVVTTTRSLMGSPLYMAPEQLVSAKEVDARADLWALGTVLFQLISGRTPYEAASLPEVVAQVLHNAPPKLSSLVPGAPRKLDSIVTRCLAKDKTERYPSVAELAADLAEVVPEASHLAMRSAAVLGVARHSTAIPVSRPRSRRGLMIAAAIGALVIGGIAAALVAGGGDKEATDSAPTGASIDIDKAANENPDTSGASNEAAAVEKEAPAKPMVREDTVIEVAIPDSAAAKRSKRTTKAKKKSSRADKKSAASAEPTKAKGGELLEPDLDAPVKKKKKKKRKKGEVLEPEL